MGDLRVFFLLHWELCHVGFTDPYKKDRVVWQHSRYARQGLSWHVAK